MSEYFSHPEELDEIELKIILIMKEIIRDYREKFGKQGGSNEWITDAIKDRIGELGYKREYDVCSSRHDGEWLFDLAWYRKAPTGHLQSLELVLESELSDRKPHELQYDYEKTPGCACRASGFYLFRGTKLRISCEHGTPDQDV